MKLKSFIFAIAAIFSLAAATDVSAQLRLGLGYTSGLRRDIDLDNGGKVLVKNNSNGFYITGTYNIDLLQGNWGVFGIEPGLVYSYLGDGEKESVAGITVKAATREHYLDIPVLAKYGYDFMPGKLGAYAFFGPSFSFGLASHTRVTMDGSVMGQEFKGHAILHNYSGKVTVKDLDKDIASDLTDGGDPNYGLFDVKLGLGFGLKVIDCIDVRFGYNFGLVNRNTGVDKATDKIKSNQLYVGVAYLF